jgi:hypothetical protein
MSLGFSGEESRMVWTRRLTCLSLLLLVGSTWRLWIPHQKIPAVPAAAVLSKLPDALQWLLLVSTLATAAIWGLRTNNSRVAATVFAGSLASLLALDQLRWQPWAYQAWLFIVVIALAQPSQATRWLQWLAIGMYFHSGISKLDYEFGTTLGQQFLATLLGFGGLQLESLSENARRPLALLFPMVELLLAGLLCSRRTARFGVIVAVFMHLATIAILGPWGLGHQSGVLIWNIWMAMQTPVLFWPIATSTASKPPPERKAPRGDYIAAALVIAAIVLPFSTRWGWWDTWPSWGLYAPGAERSTVLVHELGLTRLPPQIQNHVRGDETWRQLKLDQWVLSEFGAPLYPQNRVRLALALAMLDRHQLGDLLRVELESPTDRWTGERASRLLTDRREIAKQLQTYWLNALPTP